MLRIICGVVLVHVALAAPIESIIQRRRLRGKMCLNLRQLNIWFCGKLLGHRQSYFYVQFISIREHPPPRQTPCKPQAFENLGQMPGTPAGNFLATGPPPVLTIMVKIPALMYVHPNNIQKY